MTDREEVLQQLHVSRETEERLDSFLALLGKWTTTINLVSRATLSSAWLRHILDSAQLFALRPAAARHWADLGTGGGFPGVVVAILAKEDAHDLRFTFVESDQRKAAFLSAVVRDLGLQAVILAERIEDAQPLAADVVSARALAPLPDLLGYTRRHIAPGGVALFPKGASVNAELAESLERWRFSVQKHPSRTDPEAVVLQIGEIERV